MENFEKEQEFFVDTFGTEMFEKWQKEGSLYQRKVEQILRVEKVTKSERVETRLPDGTTESVQEANRGDWKITGSKGEVFVFNQEKVDALYTTDELGNFIPRRRQIKVLKNPYGRPIKINVLGSTKDNLILQSGSKNCFLVVSLDDTGEMTNDRYIIGDEEILLGNYEPVIDNKSKI